MYKGLSADPNEHLMKIDYILILSPINNKENKLCIQASLL